MTKQNDDPTQLDFFDYELPESAIAQTPVEPRDSARMLVDVGSRGALEVGALRSGVRDSPAVDSKVGQLADFLRPGDLVVVNNTKVLAARLLLNKSTGGQVEVFVLQPSGRPDEWKADQWKAMVRPSKRVAPGAVLYDGDSVALTVGERVEDGLRLVQLARPDLLETVGRVPLPPYITTELEDHDRYQTMFADQLGSVAAPTAGLHFTPALCDSLAASDIQMTSVELQVGLGTFRPIMASTIAEHHMHAERYMVTPETWNLVQQTRADGGRVVAVGTTVVRALESVAAFEELTGETELFINRSFDWRVVDVLLTNFHMPKSSLLVLLDSFAPGRWRSLYAQALDLDFRFLSFGDCMLIERSDQR